MFSFPPSVNKKKLLWRFYVSHWSLYWNLTNLRSPARKAVLHPSTFYRIANLE
ncbi:hypothetical protein [Chroococcidiopsis sp.]|uniref:hypothetical protein n=1 Tax=Chroococcidiopsis sp. TaxID=3088168 RepID=UPI003F40786A